MERIKIKAATLVEALPYIRKFHGKVVVIKYGGKVMTSEEAQRSAMTDIVLLKHVGLNPVVVHGGGPEITRRMKERRVRPRFVNGLRVTDARTIKIVRESFEEINGRIEGFLNKSGGKAIGLVAGRNTLFRVSPLERTLGYVGRIEHVESRAIRALIGDNYIPVVSPLGMDEGGRLYNINADTAATHLAEALRAEKLTLMTDVDGVIIDGEQVRHLTIRRARDLIRRGKITEGMIPKVEAAVHSVRAGVRKAHLINGTVVHGLLLEIFTRKGIGTEIVK